MVIFHGYAIWIHQFLGHTAKKTLRQGMSVVIVGGSNGASINQYWVIYVDLTKTIIEHVEKIWWYMII